MIFLREQAGIAGMTRTRPGLDPPWIVADGIVFTPEPYAFEFLDSAVESQLRNLSSTIPSRAFTEGRSHLSAACAAVLSTKLLRNRCRPTHVERHTHASAFGKNTAAPSRIAVLAQ